MPDPSQIITDSESQKVTDPRGSGTLLEAAANDFCPFGKHILRGIISIFDMGFFENNPNIATCKVIFFGDAK